MFARHLVFTLACFEVFSVFTFDKPFVRDADGKLGDLWSMPASHEAGDLGFDPLGLKPTNPGELKAMQTKELNNGRLAMLACAGIVTQELVTGQGLFN